MIILENYIQNSFIILLLVFIYDFLLKNIVDLYFIHYKIDSLNKINILPIYINQSEYFNKIDYDLNHVIIDIEDECTCQIFYIDEDELKNCQYCSIKNKI